MIEFLPQSRIVGGRNATAGEFPPMAALYNPNISRLYCGGSISKFIHWAMII